MRQVVVGSGGRRVRRLLLLTGCLVLGVLGLGALGAQAATPSSLAGETFTSQRVKGSTLTGACDDEGGNFSFSVSGTATGPFPGTFTESGTFTAHADGFLIDFSSTFTITSTSGTVTGTKRLVGDESHVFCDADFLTTDQLTTTYAAAINGTGRDQGAAMVNITGVVGEGSPVFSETFGSTGVVQKHCEHGEWKSFGTMFKNQGDCVSFFATGGKNPPAGRSSGRSRPVAGRRSRHAPAHSRRRWEKR